MIDWPLFVFTVALSFLWALMEIQIEGKEGWARNLPTWRIPNHRCLDLVYGGAEITGHPG